MVKLKELKISTRFFWNGQKWMVAIIPKNPLNPRKYKIVCAMFPQGDWVYMPSNRKVKPIIKITNEVKKYEC